MFDFLDDLDAQHRAADAALVDGLTPDDAAAIRRVAIWLDEESRLRNLFAGGFGESAGVFARKLRTLVEHFPEPARDTKPEGEGGR